MFTHSPFPPPHKKVTKINICFGKISKSKLILPFQGVFSTIPTELRVSSSVYTYKKCQLS